MAGYIQDTILLLGDSLTQQSLASGGLSQRLSDVYQRKLDVVNRGFSGYNSRWALPVFQNVFSKKSERANLPTVKILTIWFGANDAVEPEGTQHVPLEEYSSNLSKLIQLVKSPSSEWYSPETRIVLITPPPVNTTLWLAFLKEIEVSTDHSDRTVERTKTYAEAAIAVGKKEDVPVVDVFSLLWSAAGENEEGLKKFLSDGLHLKPEGYQLAYDALIKSISENYPELHYDKLPLAYPDWKEVNTDNFVELLKDPLVKKQS